MKTSRLILYRTPVVISLHRAGSGPKTENPTMNRSEFVLYQGADATIEFVIRDNDRKPVNLLGKTLQMTVLDPQSDALVLSKRIRVSDPHKGTCRVRFSPGDLLGVLPQYYAYSVQMQNPDGTGELLMTDQNSTARGVLEVRDGVLPQPVRSIEITAFPWDKLTPVSAGDPPVTRWIAGPFPADGPAADPDGVHTLAAYLQGFRGNLRVQASLLDQPPSWDHDWFDLDLGTGGPLAFDGETGVEAWNFVGRYRWVRLIIEPVPHNDGHIAKMYLRN